MPQEKKEKFELIADDPWMFLNERGNPTQGRRLIFKSLEGTTFEIGVSLLEYKNIETVKAKLAEFVKAHEAITSL